MDTLKQEIKAREELQMTQSKNIKKLDGFSEFVNPCPGLYMMIQNIVL